MRVFDEFVVCYSIGWDVVILCVVEDFMIWFCVLIYNVFVDGIVWEYVVCIGCDFDVVMFS